MGLETKENPAPEAGENTAEAQSKKAAKKLAKEAAKAAKVILLNSTINFILKIIKKNGFSLF